MPFDNEDNALGQRALRYASVTANIASAGAKILGASVLNNTSNAAILRTAMGNLKGPLMKIGQLVATIPDLLPDEYARELATLQSDAPAMGWPFVRRRMASELGQDWVSKFQSFEPAACSAASLGQVHKAITHDGETVACKLQYPNMASVVEADLQQLKLAFALFEQVDSSVSTGAAYDEIALRLREELDYSREARSMRFYHDVLSKLDTAHTPQPIEPLCTPKLLTMTWMAGERMLHAVETRSQEDRNQIALNMFKLWYYPFYKFGAIHGDPHLGNYTVNEDNSINLLDFGCIRLFDPTLVRAVIMLYHALKDNDDSLAADAYKLWGFQNLSKDLLSVLTTWAKFIYAPVLQDSTRPLEETNSTAYGREVASKVHKELKKLGGVDIPPEFVLIDRASIGLGSVFLRLRARVNWREVFHGITKDFDENEVSLQQASLRQKHGI